MSELIRKLRKWFKQRNCDHSFMFYRDREKFCTKCGKIELLPRSLWF